MIDARPTRPGPNRPGPAASNRRAADPDFEHGLRRASDPRATKRQATPGLAAAHPPAHDSTHDAPAEATPLRRPNGLPMLLLSRHSRDERGTPVEWVRAVYRGSRYRFTAILTPPTPPTPPKPPAP